jgi:hypothetical protein
MPPAVGTLGRLTVQRRRQIFVSSLCNYQETNPYVAKYSRMQLYQRPSFGSTKKASWGKGIKTES